MLGNMLVLARHAESVRLTAGIALCLTVIGIADFELVPAAFWPLGRQVVDFDRQRTPAHV